MFGTFYFKFYKIVCWLEFFALFFTQTVTKTIPIRHTLYTTYHNHEQPLTGVVIYGNNKV